MQLLTSGYVQLITSGCVQPGRFRFPLPESSSRLQCFETEQGRSAPPLSAFFAVLPNSRFGPSVPNARTHLRSGLSPLVVCPPFGLPYHPASWPIDRQTPAVPHARNRVVRNQEAGGDISSTQFGLRRAHATAVATAGFDCAMRGPPTGTAPIRIEPRQPYSSPCQSLC